MVCAKSDAILAVVWMKWWTDDVAGPGNDMVKCSIGQSEREHQAGHLWIPAVMSFSLMVSISALKDACPGWKSTQRSLCPSKQLKKWHYYSI